MTDSDKALMKELLSVAKGYKEYILALPDDVVAQLPAMPGIDGDWADETIDAVERQLGIKGGK